MRGLGTKAASRSISSYGSKRIARVPSCHGRPRRFYHSYATHRTCNHCQSARHRKDQIGLSDGVDRRHKEWKTEHNAPLCADLRQRAIHQGLLTTKRSNLTAKS
jgi:hypothetical protein